MPSVPPALALSNNMEPKYFTLTLTIEQLNSVMAGLGELPFKVSNDLIQNIVKQFNEQQTKAEEVVQE